MSIREGKENRVLFLKVLYELTEVINLGSLLLFMSKTDSNNARIAVTTASHPQPLSYKYRSCNSRAAPAALCYGRKHGAFRWFPEEMLNSNPSQSCFLATHHQGSNPEHCTCVLGLQPPASEQAIQVWSTSGSAGCR